MPDIYLNAALSSTGVWNSAQYHNPAYDAAFKSYQGSVGVAAQKAAAHTIETMLLEDSPTLFPYFYNYLSAHTKQFANIEATAIGHMFLAKAGRV